MEDLVPLLQTILWIVSAIALVFYLNPEIKIIRKALVKRLDAGGSVKVGPVEFGELRYDVDMVKNKVEHISKRVTRLFLTTMAPAMHFNLTKIGSCEFGSYRMSQGLKRELYYLRDIGYVEIESITKIPECGKELSDYVKITEIGRKFLDLRLEIEKEGISS